jgi:GAF domain-containing protein
MSALFLERLFEGVVEHARSAIGAHQAVASLTLGPEWSQTIVALSLSDKYADYRTYDEKPQGTGIYTLVCRQNRPMRLTQGEIEAHPAWQNFGSQSGRHPPMRGWLAAPLVGLDGRNLGLVQLSDKYEGEFTAQDEAMLVQLAHIASAASETVRLTDAVRRTTHDFNNLLTVIIGL